MTTTDNLHQQLEPDEVVLDGEAEKWRLVAEMESGELWLWKEHWAPPNVKHSTGDWHTADTPIALRPKALSRLSSMLPESADLTATTEQLDVYRTRCQQLANRVQELEDLHDAASRSVEALDAKAGDLESDADRLRHSLSALIARVRSVGGYATPEEQDVLREAERVAAGRD